MKGTLNILIERIQDKAIRQDKDFSFVVVGGKGSGKSSWTAKLLSLLDPKFDINRVAFYPKQFIDIVLIKNLYDGAAVMFDDVGISADRQEWWTEVNRTLGKVFQTIRKRHLIIGVTLPNKNILNKRLFETLTAYGETIPPIDRVHNKVECKFQYIQINQKEEKIYYHRPVIPIGNRMVYLNSIKLGLPPKPFWLKYEKMRDDFGIAILKDAQDKFIKDEEIRLKKYVNIDRIMEEVRQNPKQFKGRYGAVSKYLIMAKYKIGEGRAKTIKAMVEQLLEQHKKPNKRR